MKEVFLQLFDRALNHLAERRNVKIQIKRDRAKVKAEEREITTRTKAEAERVHAQVAAQRQQVQWMKEERKRERKRFRAEAWSRRRAVLSNGFGKISDWVHNYLAERREAKIRLTRERTGEVEAWAEVRRAQAEADLAHAGADRIRRMADADAKIRQANAADIRKGIRRVRQQLWRQAKWQQLRAWFLGWLYGHAQAANLALCAAIVLGVLTLIGLATHNPRLWAGCLWPTILALRWRSFASSQQLSGANRRRNFNRMLMPRLTTIYAGTMLVSVIRIFTR